MARNIPRESARRILWGDREVLLPHLFEHKNCGVYDAVLELCGTAGWTMESYLIAALFGLEELLVEGTE